MAKKKKYINRNIKCDICGYQNLPCYVKESGICHLCGKILDERNYFKVKLNRKLKLWKDDRPDEVQKGVNQRCNK